MHKTLRIIFGILWLSAFNLQAQEEADAPRRRGGAQAVDMTELRAKRMMDNAMELLQTGQGERGVAMLEAVGSMFPESQTRFSAALALGRHLVGQKKYQDAIAPLRLSRESTDAEEQAESWFQLGAIAFYQADYNAAFANLRRVTNEYPASAFANHAYDYIGQAHFKQGRWGKAVEAFEMVGTAVPASLLTGDEVLAEAGQRLFVKVDDQDLQILNMLGQDVSVTFEAESGDREEARLEKLGRSGKDWLASIRMAPEPGAAGDGILSVQGGEWITVSYVDSNTESGEVDVKKTSRIRLVSTGSVSVTDGAYNRSVRGVFAGQPAYVKLIDLDLDRTAEPDTVEVEVVVEYLPEKTESAEAAIEGLDVTELEPETPEWVERERITISLTETGNHTGEFRGGFSTVLSGENPTESAVVRVQPQDRISVLYLDETHLRSRSPQERRAQVTVVVGGSTDPQSIVSVANDADTQGRKLLIEAQLLHRWGSIFKEVGLEESATLKAEEGLGKVDEIMKLTARQSISREILEQSFAVKWNLYLVQNELEAAIQTALSLVRLFPDTDLVDVAFMSIARARAESEELPNKREALRVYGRVLDLPASELKAEARFRMGEVTEELIKLETQVGNQPNMAPSIAHFQICADSFPDSPFAGDAYNKIITYQIELRDYSRAVELMDRVVQDYPDAPWLDRILLQWGVVAHRMGQVDVAKAKFLQVLEEYPNGTVAARATQFLNQLR